MRILRYLPLFRSLPFPGRSTYPFIVFMHAMLHVGLETLNLFDRDKIECQPGGANEWGQRRIRRGARVLAPPLANAIVGHLSHIGPNPHDSSPS